jgi:hypothetical protein
LKVAVAASLLTGMTSAGHTWSLLHWHVKVQFWKIGWHGQWLFQQLQLLHQLATGRNFL